MACFCSSIVWLAFVIHERVFETELLELIKKAFGGWDRSLAARRAPGDGWGGSAVLPKQPRVHCYRGELALGWCHLVTRPVPGGEGTGHPDSPPPAPPTTGRRSSLATDPLLPMLVAATFPTARGQGHLASWR